jgi:hypothetical protein
VLCFLVRCCLFFPPPPLVPCTAVFTILGQAGSLGSSADCFLSVRPAALLREVCASASSRTFFVRSSKSILPCLVRCAHLGRLSSCGWRRPLSTLPFSHSPFFSFGLVPRPCCSRLFFIK